MASVAKVLGPYELLASIGAGGMGEVWRARDPRLDREVAIKILPAKFSSDADRLRRFQQEAKAAAALNHPNILAVYDVGVYNDAPYLVTELLQGESLRERLRGGALPVRKVVEIAAQIARGIAAAHDRGIVHRDLKPENVFVTRDGQVKILDFGLAKLLDAPALEGTSLPTKTEGTSPGMVLGTVGYMSPEQVRGQALDHRTDIFSFGAILYEMISGRRAFQGESTADTLSAILREEPPEISGVASAVTPAVDRVVRHCLEKDPQQRFQSARDIAFDLEALSSSSISASPALASAVASRNRKLRFAILGTAALVLATVAAFLAGSALRSSAPPNFQHLTFRNGVISSGRFGPDGRTAYFSARWASSPTDLFSLALPSSPAGGDIPRMQSLGLHDAEVVAVGKSGDMLVLTDIKKIVGNATIAGTLARVQGSGEAPKPLLENVSAADFAPDGSLAVVRYLPESFQFQLEYPVGTVLYRAPGWLEYLRFSRDGTRIAFLDHPAMGDDRGTVAAVDLHGKYRKLTPDFDSLSGLAWAPDGSLWFSLNQENEILSVPAKGGQPRRLWQSPSAIALMDANADGTALVKSAVMKLGMMASPPGSKQERDISWLDFPVPRDLSQDGKRLLFSEQAAGHYSAYLGFTDGSPAVRLGDGDASSLSPDEAWAAAIKISDPAQVMLLPTGAGEPRQLTHDILNYQICSWFPDGKKLACIASEAGHGARTYSVDVASGNATPLTPDGVLGFPLSPDGHYLAENRPVLWDLQGRASVPVRGILTGDVASGWAQRDHVVITNREGNILHVIDLDPFTGTRKHLRDISVPAIAGYSMDTMITNANAQAYAYRYIFKFDDLASISGLR